MRYYFILILILFSFSLFAQNQDSCTFTLTGKVLDDHNGEPLAFANIYLPEIEKGTSTDEKGYYTITGLCKGKYKIQCSHIGCDVLTDWILINGSIKKNFSPEHHSHELEQITIVDEKVNLSPTHSQTILSSDELERNGSNTLGEILSKIPGIHVLKTGSSIAKPLIHGLHSNRILILNNEVRQQGQQWGQEHAPEIDPLSIHKITIIKGASAVRYGSDAIGGVIITEAEPLNFAEESKGLIFSSFNSNGRSGVISGLFERNSSLLPFLSWRLQGTLKQTGNFKTPQYYLGNTGVKEYDFSFATTLQKKWFNAELLYSQFNTDIGIFEGSHIGNLTDLLAAFERDTLLTKYEFSYNIAPPFQHIEHELFKVKSKIKTGDKNRIEIILSRQYNQRQEFDERDPLEAESQFNLTSKGSDVNWKHIGNKGLRSELGINFQQQVNTGSGTLLIPNYKSNEAGIYLIEQLKKYRYDLEAGLRYDVKKTDVYLWQNNKIINPQYDYNNFSGSIGTLLKFSEKLNFNLNTGTAWRPPSMNELYSNGLHHGTAAIETGDSTLKKEAAFKAITSLNFDNKKHFKATVTIYQNTIYNYIYLAPTLIPALTVRGAFPSFEYKQANANLTGGEFDMEWKINNLFSFLSQASILRAKNKETNEFLTMMPADRVQAGFQIKFKDQGLLKNAFIDLTFENIFRQKNIPENSDYVPPPKGYNLFHTSIGGDLILGKQKITFRLSINNILNKEYRDYLNRFRYYADDMGRNILFSIKIPLTLTDAHKIND